MNWRYFLCSLWLPFLSVLDCPLLAEEPVDFTRDIRPLLSDRCFTCHGPDAGQRVSDLRLDDPASAHELAIDANAPAASELVRRIKSDDPDEVMPPPESNLQLSVAEKDLLTRWVNSGGAYSQHWAFVAPERPPIPDVQFADWPRNDLDRFVLQPLEQRGLKPSPPAELETLIRRVSLDLTGLPPTLAEIDAFIAASQQNAELAYERLVDRLLASERYGERMAVDWLDVARYADTYGYQNDRYRAMWPWRDWVVQAFNDNLPYDEFITWQIAGDLLPDATRDQILATAFNRNHRQTNEGGSVEEEFRTEYVADRVNTFGAAFLGLTLECCRCHDHKYDPLTQREYYQLAAFFNSIDESGLYSHFTEATPTPTLLLPDSSEAEALAEIESQLTAKQRELANWTPDSSAFHAWRATLSDIRQIADGRPSAPRSDRPGEEVSLRMLLEQSLQQALIGDFPLEQIENGKLVNQVDGENAGKVSESPTLVAAKVGNGLRLSGENNVAFPTGGDFSRNQPFTVSLWLKSPERFARAIVFHRSRAWTDAGSQGYELLIEDGRLSAALIHFWPGNAIRIVSREELPLDRWVHVAVRYDGSSTAGGLSLFVNGERAETEVVRDHLTKQIQSGDSRQLVFGQRFRDVGFKHGEIDEIKVFDRDLSDLELRTVYLQGALPENLSEFLHNAGEELLRDYFIRQQADRQHLLGELRALRDRRSAVGDPIVEIMVMREDKQPRATFVLTRGAYDAPADPVHRATPASILPQEPTPDANRIDLAEWLVDPRHPLTARVAVNRFWQSLFGRGLVPTAEDFGLQGDAPSNAALLDWLSVEFVQSGWDVKELLKTIVMSATYRQRSDPTPQLLDSDPENRWLARGPAVRLSAEMLRDSLLFASGVLAEKIGGPPTKPYQPEGLWKEKSGLVYKRDVGEGSHRRSLYTYWKRTSPPPAMMTLDASNREVCVVRRQVTMTPLQTLLLLNDPQYVEAARILAERAMRNCEQLESRLAFLYRSLTGSQPTRPAIAVLTSMFHEQLAVFQASPEATTRWLEIGDHRISSDLDPSEIAALAVVAGGLMNFDATVMKR